MRKEFPLFLSKLPAILGLSPQEIVAALIGMRLSSMLEIKELGTIPIILATVMVTRFTLRNLDFAVLLTKRKKKIKLSDFRGNNETDF